jgi:hypothetical protein
MRPSVLVPDSILELIYSDAGRDKGGIAAKVYINRGVFKKTLVKYQGN